MRDLRRYNPTAVVQNAGRVNVGGRQVNVVSKLRLLKKDLHESSGWVQYGTND